MKMNKRFFTLALASALLMTASQAFAVTIGEDDLDGSLTAGATYGTVPADPGFNGLFSASGSRFDRWGIVNRTVDDADGPGSQGLPFDFIDESVAMATGGTGVFPEDDLGILKSTETDNKFLVADLNNGSNPSGTGSVTWTFDITGYENITVSMDWAGQGNFDTGDEIDVFATIDAGTPEQIMDGTHDPGAPAFFTNEDGFSPTVTTGTGTWPATASPFWNAAADADWLTLTTTGPFTNGSGEAIDFSTFDVDMDGLDDTYGTKVLQTTNTFGTFQDSDFDILLDPMVITADGTDYTLNNDYQTITAPVTGTGTTLTLTVNFAQDGSLEFLTFDNLLIEGDLITGGIPEDLNNDGFVDGLDLGILLGSWGTSTTPDMGELDGTPPVDGLDLGILLAAWNPPPAVAAAAVPEPTSIALLGLAGLALVSRRQR